MLPGEVYCRSYSCLISPSSGLRSGTLDPDVDTPSLVGVRGTTVLDLLAPLIGCSTSFMSGKASFMTSTNVSW